ncbi:MAG: hypothetical protein KY445_11465 [Armatimonadetes bacterium]|nr:hypothetical protein [Armatimonadota bacterium]
MPIDLSTRIADANALPLSPSPFSQGIQAEDFRVQVREHGERVRWLQAIEAQLGPNGEQPTRGGVVYVEKPLAPEIRVFLYQETRDVAVEQFGLLARGNMMISFLPDEIDPIRDDRFVALERTLTSRQALTPSGAATDALNHRDAVSVSSMWDSVTGVIISPTRYTVENGVIRWTNTLADPRPTGEVTLVYKYRPHYEWLGENAHQAFLGEEGARLPGKGPLRLLTAGEE